MTTNFKSEKFSIPAGKSEPAEKLESELVTEVGRLVVDNNITFAIKEGSYPVFNAIMPTKGGYILNFINGVYVTDDPDEIAYLRKEHVAAGHIVEQ